MFLKCVINSCLLFFLQAEDECHSYSSDECTIYGECQFDIINKECKFDCKTIGDRDMCNVNSHGCQWINYNSSTGECINVDLVHDCDYFTDGRQCECNDFFKNCVLSKTEGICHYAAVPHMICLNYNNNPVDCLAEPYCIFQFKCVDGVRTSETCQPIDTNVDRNEVDTKEAKSGGFGADKIVLLVVIAIPAVLIIVGIVSVTIAFQYYKKKVSRIDIQMNVLAVGDIVPERKLGEDEEMRR